MLSIALVIRMNGLDTDVEVLCCVERGGGGGVCRNVI